MKHLQLVLCVTLVVGMVFVAPVANAAESSNAGSDHRPSILQWITWVFGVEDDEDESDEDSGTASGGPFPNVEYDFEPNY